MINTHMTSKEFLKLDEMEISQLVNPKDVDIVHKQTKLPIGQKYHKVCAGLYCASGLLFLFSLGCALKSGHILTQALKENKPIAQYPRYRKLMDASVIGSVVGGLLCLSSLAMMSVQHWDESRWKNVAYQLYKQNQNQK